MPRTDGGSGSRNLAIKVTRGRLYEQVARQLQELILTGALKPGDRLPPERELAEQLGVSRVVIREAMKTLEERGLLKVLTGSGTYISQIEPRAISESINLLIQQRAFSFDHLNEIRRMLEIEIAGLAAERARPEDLQTMEQAISVAEAAAANLESVPTALDAFVQADLAFHNALAEATQNPLFPVLLESMSDLLIELRWQASSQAGAPQDALDYHRAILAHVKVHDLLASREAMREHLMRAEEYLKASRGEEG